LLESTPLEYAENFAAMSSAITIMCTEMLEDMNVGKMNQLIIRAEKLLLVCARLNDQKYIIVGTEDLSKVGILLKTIDANHLSK
jgi:predicted regulator of Ras-like GTPase activity (Roadblock/LC7/MglB family)